MRKIFLLLAFCCSLAAEEETSPERSGWILTFSDEFDGEKLDYEKWTPKDPWGVVRNEELQGYWIKAFHVAEGILRIRCEDKPSFYDGARRDFRSGMMTTSGKFSQRYGRFEIRCRVPRGTGLWPAFWMLPEPPSWPPEIDILEVLCQEPNRVYLTHHWPRRGVPDESDSVTEEFQGPDFSEDFHVFALEWDPGELRWFVDGVERHRATRHVPEVPMFLLVNLAVGGWAEAPDEDTVFPAEFEIDYVRAWKRSDS